MPYIVDPARFKAEGVLLDWTTIARRLRMDYVGRSRYMLQLRWMTHGVLGMPTEPFIVWRRPKGMQLVKALNISVQNQVWLFGDSRVTWTDGPMAKVVVGLQALVGGEVYAYAAGPHKSNAVAVTAVPAGSSTITLVGPMIDGLIASPGITVSSVTGTPLDQLSQAAGWQQYELVGLPVPVSEWSGIHKYAANQGMLGALTAPQTAAIQRLTRGAPQVGWQTNLPTGEIVPAWQAPSLGPLVTSEVKTDVIDKLRMILPATPPNQQGDATIPVVLPPPQNPLGQQMPSEGVRTTQVSPLAMTLMAAGSEACLALGLGFGTAYPASAESTGASAQDYDYMISARWEAGLDGKSAPFEMAAVVPAPTWANPVPTPANLTLENMGYLRPLTVDADWGCSVKSGWDRPPDLELFRPRSYAFVRASVAPAEPVTPVMEPRTSGGFRYPVINAALPDPLPADYWRLGAVDREVTIPSATGTRTLRHGVCHQDLYGQWSPWSVVTITVSQPAVDDVRIVNATLTASVVGPDNPVAAGALTIEFLWNWRIRSPEKVRFVGRLYAAQQHGDPPPSVVVPAGLQRSLGGGGASLDITFAGDTPSAPGASIVGLTADGEAAVPFGPQQGQETRRYRVTLSDFTLDFTSTGHIGLALWANGQEHIPPQRTGAWSNQPSVISTSDPRPPMLQPAQVTLASLPDAAGECHARLAWTASSNATGYFVYEATETDILLANNQAEPDPEATLSQRLEKLKAVFNANPSRETFTRRNHTALDSTSTDITLPRGSTAIHVFTVIGINAGQVESAWPSGPDAAKALQAFAAPRVLKPAPPTLEVIPYVDHSINPAVYGAQVRVGARPGPRVRKVDVFRVRVPDAAKDLDTMGPPVAIITGSGGGWKVTQTSDGYGTNIQSVSGLDTPSGTWKYVWYRAVAWTDPDPLRGYLPGRSSPSSAAAIVVPPADPPNLSAIDVSWPLGGTPEDVLLTWTSTAPVQKTPLGPHTLTVHAAAPGAQPLVEVNVRLDAVPTTEPADSGVWLTNPSGPAPFTYSARLRRMSVNDALQVTVRMMDPLGRSSESLVSIASGPVLQAPDLTDFVVAPSVNPPGTMLTWKSQAPYAMWDPAPYGLRVTAVRPQLIKFPPPPIVLQMPLPDVPLDEPGPVPAGVDPLRVRRVETGGPQQDYYAFCRVSVARFVVRLTAPDNRSVEQTISVS